MVSSADRTIVARTAPRTVQNSLPTCRARSRGARARKGTALLSSTAEAAALCRPLSRSTGSSQRESTARPHHPGGQSVLDRQALADLNRAFAFEQSTRSDAKCEFSLQHLRSLPSVLPHACRILAPQKKLIARREGPLWARGPLLLRPYLATTAAGRSTLWVVCAGSFVPFVIKPSPSASCREPIPRTAARPD